MTAAALSVRDAPGETPTSRFTNLFFAGLFAGPLSGCGPSRPDKIDLWSSAESIVRAYRESGNAARAQFWGRWAGVAIVFDGVSRYPRQAIVVDRMGTTYSFPEDAMVDLMRLRPRTPMFVFGRIAGYRLGFLRMTRCHLDDAQFAHELDLRSGGKAPAVQDASRVRFTLRLANGPRQSESIQYARFGVEGVAGLDVDVPLAAGLKQGDVVEIVGSLSPRGDTLFLWAHEHRKLL